MQTKFIAIAVSLSAPADELSTGAHGLDTLRSPLQSDALKDRIETQLAEYGIPLRWAVTSIERAGDSGDDSADDDSGEQVAHVEAVVTLL
ncbi:MAG: hypothetical protein AAFP03_07680 [Cyanobacteria bacterium J06598_3]